MKRGAVSLMPHHKGTEYKQCSLSPHSPRGEYRQSNGRWSSRENTSGKEWLLAALLEPVSSHELVKLLDFDHPEQLLVGCGCLSTLERDSSSQGRKP